MAESARFLELASGAAGGVRELVSVVVVLLGGVVVVVVVLGEVVVVVVEVVFGGVGDVVVVLDGDVLLMPLVDEVSLGALTSPGEVDVAPLLLYEPDRSL